MLRLHGTVFCSHVAVGGTAIVRYDYTVPFSVFMLRCHIKYRGQ